MLKLHFVHVAVELSVALLAGMGVTRHCFAAAVAL